MPGGINKNPFMHDAMGAVAAWIELEATIKMIEVATMRGKPQAEIEELRQRAHDLLDEHMNYKQGLQALARSHT